MHTECTLLSQDSHNAGKSYYKALTHWIVRVDERTQVSCTNCSDLATTYKNSLDKLLVCLRAIRPEKLVEEKIVRAVNHQLLLEKEMKFGYHYY